MRRRTVSLGRATHAASPIMATSADLPADQGDDPPHDTHLVRVSCLRGIALPRVHAFMALQHVLVLLGVYALSRAVFGECYEGLHARFADYSGTVREFAESTPARFASVGRAMGDDDRRMLAFKEARAQWHHDMRTMAENIETKFKS